MAGLPPAVRAAWRAGREASPDRIVVAGAGEDFLRRWSPQLRAAGVPVLGAAAGSAALDPRLPLLAVDPEAFPDEGGLGALLRAGPGTRARAAGRTVAAFAPEAGACGAGRSAPEQVLRAALALPLPEAPAPFFDASSPEGAASAARALYARLGNEKDGYLARLDRRLSIALTRLMLPFPITPNAVTTASLAVGLWGAWLLAAPSPRAQFAGTLLLWLCALLDGCDGELARLKHLQSPAGAAYDLWADHAAHLAVFAALPVGVARLHPGRDWTWPGLLLVSGFLACGWSVWRLVLRVPEAERGPEALFVERVASRDYVYLLIPLAALGRLDLFVWAAALGSHAFWLWLWRLTRRRPPAA